MPPATADTLPFRLLAKLVEKLLSRIGSKSGRRPKKDQQAINDFIAMLVELDLLNLPPFVGDRNDEAAFSDLPGEHIAALHQKFREVLRLKAKSDATDELVMAAIDFGAMIGAVLTNARYRPAIQAGTGTSCGGRIRAEKRDADKPMQDALVRSTFERIRKYEKNKGKAEKKTSKEMELMGVTVKPRTVRKIVRGK